MYMLPLLTHTDTDMLGPTCTYCYVPLSCPDDILNILIFLDPTHVIKEVHKQIKIHNSSYFLSWLVKDISWIKIIKKGINNRLKNYCMETTYQND